MSRVVVLSGCLLAALALRWFCDEQWAADSTPLPPRVPLAELSLAEALPGWEVQDVPLEPDVEKVAGVSDYVNRRYFKAGRSFSFYVGYVAGWRPRSIHHPGVCFLSGGRQLIEKNELEVEIPGREEPGRFLEYLWEEAMGGTTYTLTSFYYNGKFAPGETGLRASRILGIRYFAIVTISGNATGSLERSRADYREILEKAIPRILEHMP